MCAGLSPRPAVIYTYSHSGTSHALPLIFLGRSYFARRPHWHDVCALFGVRVRALCTLFPTRRALMFLLFRVFFLLFVFSKQAIDVDWISNSTKIVIFGVAIDFVSCMYVRGGTGGARPSNAKHVYGININKLVIPSEDDDK